MSRIQKLEQAWYWARTARLEAIRQKRELHAAPRNPLEARPGHEAAFERADGAIRALDVILSELEEAHARAQRGKRRRGAARLGRLAVRLLLGFGAASLAALGAAAACVALGAPGPLTQASAAVGTALSLAWAVKAARQ